MRLMQEGVGFPRLAWSIIDEQHRFGVHQRLALRDKGRARAASMCRRTSW
jgi:ATP-dependent DNA helicase RecG